jgi:hypothetical protein
MDVVVQEHGKDSRGCNYPTPPMDMGYHAVHYLGRVLFGDGYALKHRWLLGLSLPDSPRAGHKAGQQRMGMKRRVAPDHNIDYRNCISHHGIDAFTKIMRRFKT